MTIKDLLRNIFRYKKTFSFVFLLIFICAFIYAMFFIGPSNTAFAEVSFGDVDLLYPITEPLNSVTMNDSSTQLAEINNQTIYSYIEHEKVNNKSFKINPFFTTTSIYDEKKAILFISSYEFEKNLRFNKIIPNDCVISIITIPDAVNIKVFTTQPLQQKKTLEEIIKQIPIYLEQKIKAKINNIKTDAQKNIDIQSNIAKDEAVKINNYLLTAGKVDFSQYDKYSTIVSSYANSVIRCENYKAIVSICDGYSNSSLKPNLNIQRINTNSGSKLGSVIAYSSIGFLLALIVAGFVTVMCEFFGKTLNSINKQKSKATRH